MHMQKKTLIILSILFMTIGFAAVSTTLYLNGTIGIGTNDVDFDVYFSKAIENGVENTSIIKDKTHIEFITELSNVGDQYVLEYDVTNGSKQYDANLVINCTGGNEYLRVENKFETTETLPARQTRKGTLTLTTIKSSLKEQKIEVSCEIKGNAIERNSIGLDVEENYLYHAGQILSLTPPEERDTLWKNIDQDKIETITIQSINKVPKNALGSWDVSNKQNGSIMAYTLDEDSNGYFELYLGQDGGVIANPDSRHLFSAGSDLGPEIGGKILGFNNVKEIKGLENLDTSKVTNMSSMFSGCENLTSLDVSTFDTKNVTNMSYIFADCGSLTNINVSNFDTSNVTNMRAMFIGCSEITSLNISNFDTSKVTNMIEMFSGCSGITSLNIRNFDTSNVTEMHAMFTNCSGLTNLDLSNFNTSQVTDMSWMFANCSGLTSLDLSNFNTSQVTDMDSTFSGCSNLSTKIVIMSTDVYSDYMFENAAIADGALITIDYIEEASDLVDAMIATKSDNSNVIKGNNVSNLTITITEENIRSNVTKGCKGQIIKLFPLDETQGVASFKMNGMLVEGNEFTMPETDVTITDVVLKKVAFAIHLPEDGSITSDVSIAKINEWVSLDATDETKGIVSFKVNGTLVEGNGFEMPEADVAITDVVFKQVKFSVHLPEDGTVTSDVATAWMDDWVILSSTDETKSIVSFKMNGTLVEGNTFEMPEEDVTITDVILKQVKFSIHLPEDGIVTTDVDTARVGNEVALYATATNRAVTSFKVNGILTEGNTFTMPEEDAYITEVTTVEAYVIESEHNPYGSDLENQVIGEKTFEGATSLTVILDYETEGDDWDYITLYDSAEKEYGPYGGSRKIETITIPGNAIKITFTSDGSGEDYYGFKALIIPNYEG